MSNMLKNKIYNFCIYERSSAIKQLARIVKVEKQRLTVNRIMKAIGSLKTF